MVPGEISGSFRPPRGKKREAPVMRSSKFHALSALALAVSLALPAAAQSFKVTNLLSDGSVPAANTDANFINPWAISASGNWWISAQGTGYNYVIPAAGTVSFKVIVPNQSGLTTATGLPSGSVTTGGTVGMVLPNGTKASFLFSTLDGTISGWNSKLGTANAISQIVVNNNAAGASYAGLAILNIASGGVTSASYVLAPNFGTGNSIEVYDSNFAKTRLAGTFTDPNLPAGYAPFSVHVIGTQVYVNYALRTATAPYRTVNGSGNGIVSVFDNAGNFVSRVVTGGNLNAPWGIAIAPANFGIYSNALLIGNFGDGMINVYDPKTFAYLGQLMDAAGKPLVYASLWELLPGGTTVTGTTGVSAGDVSTVYFTAGLANEAHGLLAGITNSVTAGSTPTFGFSVGAGTMSVTAGSAATIPLALAPTNGFSGTVTLACSGLPAGATCVFSPATVSVSSTAATTATVTINTTRATTAALHGSGATLAAVLGLPFVSLLVLRRRKLGVLRILPVLVLTLAAATFVAGCADGGSTPATPTPAGTSTVTITATAGTVTQSTSVAMTVK